MPSHVYLVFSEPIPDDVVVVIQVENVEIVNKIYLIMQVVYFFTFPFLLFPLSFLFVFFSFTLFLLLFTSNLK